MLDIAVSYNRYKFLGHEFLTWLWFTIEKDREKLVQADDQFQDLEIGNRMVLENRLNDDSVETLTIKGDDAGLEEAKLSLKKGAIVTELNFIYKSTDQEWKFNIKGESLAMSGLKTPETAPVEKKEDIEGAVIEKVFFYSKAIDFIDSLYKIFINIRVNNQWLEDVVPRIKIWINSDDQ